MSKDGDAMKDIIFICVNYNNSTETIKYVKHLNDKLIGYDYDIVIVDNSEQKKEYTILTEHFNKSKSDYVYIVNSQENLGYFTAMQKGIDFYNKEVGTLPEIIIIGNTDIIIESDNFLEEIKKNIKDDVLALAPNIRLNNTEIRQNPYKINRISINKLKLLKMIYGNSITTYLYNLTFKILKGKKEDNNFIEHNSNIIYAPHGSYIILSEKFFSKKGTIEYKGFLYGEEIFLAEQILRLNGKIKYCENIKIIHNENSVTKLLEDKKKRIYKLNSTKFLINYINSN